MEYDPIYQSGYAETSVPKVLGATRSGELPNPYILDSAACDGLVTIPKGARYIVVVVTEGASGQAQGSCDIYLGDSKNRIFEFSGSPPPDGETRTTVLFKDLESLAVDADKVISMGASTKRTSGSYSCSALYQPIRVSLTQTPRTFRPLDSREPSIAQCDRNPQLCFPNYLLKVVLGPPSYGSAAINFESDGSGDPVLQKLRAKLTISPSTVNGQPQPWLPGNSTNHGTDNNPDFQFDQLNRRNPSSIFMAPKGLEMMTRPLDQLPGDANDNTVAPFTVTSLDYGGAARISASVEPIDGKGPTMVAEIVDPDGNAPTLDWHKTPACGKVGTGFTERTSFASLPIDIDCNGIADSWEDQNSTLNGAHLPADWDKEPGYGPNVGDGLTVHDEYRGFHYILDDRARGDQVAWTSTDPANKLDVFFWDPSSQFTQAVRSVLANQPPPGTFPTPSKFSFRRVNAEQANAVSRTRPLQGVRCLNPNQRLPRSLSCELSTSSPNAGKALVYVDFQLPTNDITAELGNAGTAAPDGLPIKISLSSVKLNASANKISAKTLLAQVVAHETGHKWGLRHPLRPDCCSYVSRASLVGKNLTTLLPSQFTLDPLVKDGSGSKTAYVRLRQYSYSGVKRADSFETGVGITIAKISQQTTESGDERPVYKLKYRKVFLSSMNPWVQIQRTLEAGDGFPRLMDWTPNLNYLADGNIADWRFDTGWVVPREGSLEGICLRILAGGNTCAQ